MESSRNGSIGFIGLLTIAFIVLKLCNVITWSWFLVLSPLIISTAIGLFIISGFLLSQYPAYRKRKKAYKRVSQIMKEQGLNIYEASMAYKKEVAEKTNTPLPKSKWQERYEQMVENQKKLK